MIRIDVNDYVAGLRRDAAMLAAAFSGDASQVDIFVPRNSPAGKYAFIQHDVLKGRGVGTVKKGERAGWKYLERARDDNEGKISALIDKGVDAVIQSFGRGRQMARVLAQIGMVVQREGRKNAKRSPSKSQYKRTLKTARGRQNSTFKASPGGLEKSITYEVK